MRRISISIFFAIISMSKLTIQGGETHFGPGCFKVREDLNSCAFCFRGNMHKDKEQKNYVCRQGEPMEIKNCAIERSLTGFDSDCRICEEGYALDILTGRCVQTNVKKCIWAFWKFGYVVCEICEGGFPRSSRKCAEFAEFQPGEPEYEYIENCQWGKHLDSGEDRIGCYRCKPGFVVDAGTRKCIPDTGEDYMKGCMAVWTVPRGNRECLYCDVWNGYTGYLDENRRVLCQKQESNLLED